jgi:ATP-dependent RNA helicase DDX6/DHH1
VIVATPGRILDLASKNIAKLNNCKMLVLDEVDKLLSDDFKIIVAKIIDLMPEDRQISLFSATYPMAIKGFQK